jgi:hypothetical protein
LQWRVVQSMQADEWSTGAAASLTLLSDTVVHTDNPEPSRVSLETGYDSYRYVYLDDDGHYTTEDTGVMPAYVTRALDPDRNYCGAGDDSGLAGQWERCWSTSDLAAWLNSSRIVNNQGEVRDHREDGFLTTAFTAREQAALGANYGGWDETSPHLAGTPRADSVIDTRQRILIPSVAEMGCDAFYSWSCDADDGEPSVAENIASLFGFPNSSTGAYDAASTETARTRRAHLPGEPDLFTYYWLRSPGLESPAAFVSRPGMTWVYGGRPEVFDNIGVRPLTKIKLSAVVFATPVSDSGLETTLTLADPALTRPDVTAPGVVAHGSDLTGAVTALPAGARLGAVVSDADGAVVCVVHHIDAADGFRLPTAALAAGAYRVRFFAERYEADDRVTDYATPYDQWAVLNLAVQAAPAAEEPAGEPSQPGADPSPAADDPSDAPTAADPTAAASSGATTQGGSAAGGALPDTGSAAALRTAFSGALLLLGAGALLIARDRQQARPSAR